MFHVSFGRVFRLFRIAIQPTAPVPHFKAVETIVGASSKCAARGRAVAQRHPSEEGWPASTDPAANSIEPPMAGGRAADSADDPPSQPAPAADDLAKVALLDQHRGRHA